MAHTDLLRLVQIGDSAGHLQYSMKSTGRQAELLGSRLKQALGSLFHRTVCPDFSRSHLGIAQEVTIFEPALLYLPGGTNSLPHCSRVLPRLFIYQLLVLHRRDFNKDVNAVHERTADTLLVAGH